MGSPTTIGPVEAESLRIEATAEPFTVALMLRMAGIIEGFEKLEVPSGTAAILWRACARAGETLGQPLTLGNRKDLLNYYVVHPVVAEVVEVREGGTLLEMKVRQPCEVRIARLDILVVEWLPCFEISERLAVDLELIEVTPGPAHCSLDETMEPRESHGFADEEKSPDLWLNLLEGDLQPESQGCPLRRRHTRSPPHISYWVPGRFPERSPSTLRSSSRSGQWIPAPPPRSWKFARRAFVA